MMSKEKTQNNTIKVGHKFLNLHIKFVSLVVVGQKKQTHYLVQSPINQILKILMFIHRKQNINFSYVKTSYEMYVNESKAFFVYLIGMKNFYKLIDECKTKNIKSYLIT